MFVMVKEKCKERRNEIKDKWLTKYSEKENLYPHLIIITHKSKFPLLQ